MKKFTQTAVAIGMAAASSLSAQSLFDLAPDDGETESLPLSYTAGVTFGYDGNPTPALSSDDEALYAQAYIGASFLANGPQTTTNFGAQVGVIHYFDNLDAPGVEVDDTTGTASLYLNWTHRTSERLRFVSQNFAAYELEPDYSTGYQAQRQTGNYLRWSSNNAVGYRWSERTGTYSGVKLDGISFDDVVNGDRTTVTLFSDFRYQLSERTVATLSYRHADTSASGNVSDATNQFILGGLEHRFNQRSTGVLRVGAQIRDVENGRSSNSPYVEGSFRTAINSQLSLRSYVRYGVEDFQRNVAAPPVIVVIGNDVFLQSRSAVYANTDTLRLGLTADYSVSQDLVLSGGINYAALNYNDLQVGNLANSIDDEFLNVFVGLSLRVTDNVSVNARYNLEDLTSDVDARGYDRNRFSIGASTRF